MRRKRGAMPTQDLAKPPAGHLLGTYGLDWDDGYASIAGHTSGGAPYGVPWAEADWLEDMPAFSEWVREAREERAWWEAQQPESKRDAPEVDPDEEIPF